MEKLSFMERLELSMLFNFSLGGKVFDTWRTSYTDTIGYQVWSNMSTEQLNRWQKPGDVTMFLVESIIINRGIMEAHIYERFELFTLEIFKVFLIHFHKNGLIKHN